MRSCGLCGYCGCCCGRCIELRLRVVARAEQGNDIHISTRRSQPVIRPLECTEWLALLSEKHSAWHRGGGGATRDEWVSVVWSLLLVLHMHVVECPSVPTICGLRQRCSRKHADQAGGKNSTPRPCLQEKDVRESPQEIDVRGCHLLPRARREAVCASQARSSETADNNVKTICSGDSATCRKLDLTNASIGNLVLTALRLALGSLARAVELLLRWCDVDHVTVFRWVLEEGGEEEGNGE